MARISVPLSMVPEHKNASEYEKALNSEYAIRGIKSPPSVREIHLETLRDAVAHLKHGRAHVVDDAIKSHQKQASAATTSWDRNHHETMVKLHQAAKQIHANAPSVGDSYADPKRNKGSAAADSSKPRGAVQTGARGGKYIVLKSGQKFYITSSGGKPVVRPA